MGMKLLDTAHNKYGRLEKSAKNRIRAYLDCPTETGWDDIRLIVICVTDGHLTTIREAVHLVDASFSGFAGNHPNAILTACAIKKALGFHAFIKSHQTDSL
jgi:hypothetical protein